jgi:hypothetical protein
MYGGGNMRRIKSRLKIGAFSALLGVTGGLFAPPGVSGSAPVQSGFDLSVDDLRFILQQIRIAETHATREGATLGAVVSPVSPLGTGPNDIPDPMLPWGLRQVDGRNNNLTAGWSRWTGRDYATAPGKSTWGSADQPFLRDTDPQWRDSDTPTAPTTFFGPVATTYDPVSRPSSVQDAEPRLISNLISDQSSANPAAVAAAGPGATVGADGSLEILNTAPDMGLSAPYNGMFALFGQFFDHGLDLVSKTDSEYVIVPLSPDDPTYNPASPTNFMAVKRTALDENGDGVNSTTPWIDQNQTYTSHPSHQVFLREYALNGAGRPVATGKVLDGAIEGNIANWGEVKAQAASMLGIELRDVDVFNVPLLLTDEYGRFLRGPNGLPQLVQDDGSVVEGNRTTPISTLEAARTNHAFLDDIAHYAVPNGTPDADATLGNNPGSGSYDNELLDAHFITGDGRGNENIGLTAIHSVLHSEHNRLIDQIKSVVTANAASFGATDWRLTAGGAWNGERLFQAARFVNEMEYQHIVFEQFIRKVQPFVAPFAGYDPTLRPDITAEFAHAVYRYGHSQLNSTIDRTLANGTDAGLTLLDAFLSPQKFNDDGSGNTLTAAQASGAVIRGMTRQVGNEIDEFMTDTLRNTLVGLPLDLAAINMTRARDAGMGSLNATRRSFYNQTSDPTLAPYGSWTDFGFSLRHPQSLANFIAAYGTHPTITAETTIAGRRTAAEKIVDLDASVSDAAQFLLGTGPWSDVSNRPSTGVEDIDLWVGGLAEARAPFSGMLGSTFNHVFQKQMELLQDGDRFYYLERLAGLNLLNQIEPNFLSEIMMRNSDVEALPSDPFAYPTFVFDMNGPTPAQITTLADGTWRYPGAEHVVFNGSAAGNRMWSGLGDDTARGNDDHDWIQGNQGNDVLIGGIGNDRILDSSGVDNLLGGPGDDYLGSGGVGFDVLQGNDGNDMLVGGTDIATSVGGPGTDFLIGSTTGDGLSGDDGSDWAEGGAGSDTLLGDILAPFGIDLTGFGDDVLVGGAAGDAFSGGGGVDIMFPGAPGTNAMIGDFGFDWVSYHEADPAAAYPVNVDLNLVVPVPGNPGFVDTFDQVEGLSGGDLDDVLLGDIRTALSTPGIALNDNLAAADLVKIDGLRLLLQPGVTTWTAGNMLIGGRGSDRLEGRAGNDLIDGNAWLEAFLTVPAATPVAGTIDPVSGRKMVWSAAALKDAVLNGTLNIADITIGRAVRTAPYAGETDRAVFSGNRAEYTITYPSPGIVRVVHDGAPLGAPAIDGTDTLRNIEQLVFLDQTVTVATPSEPTTVTASATTTSIAVSWAAPGRNGTSALDGYTARAYTTREGNTVAATCSTLGATTCTLNGLTNNVTYYVDVYASNGTGNGVVGPRSRLAVRTGVVPGAPTGVGATVNGNGTVPVTWAAPTTGGAATGYTATAFDAASGGTAVSSCTSTGALTCTLPPLPLGSTYYVSVRASNASGFGAASTPRVAVTPATVPDAPRVVAAYPGSTKAEVVFSHPLSHGGTAITGYTVRAFTTVNGTVPAATCNPTTLSTTAQMHCTLSGLTNGTTYSVDVVATNPSGTGAASSPRPSVRPATTPDAPAAPTLTPTAGTIDVSWTAPANPGGAISAYTVQAFAVADGTTVAGQCTTTGATSCTINGLSPETAFWVQVRATNPSGQGAPSVRAATTTLAAGPSDAALVSNLIIGKTATRVAWRPPTVNAAAVTGYTARAFTVSSGGVAVASCSTAATARDCTISGLTANTNYWFQVTANRGGVLTLSPRAEGRTLRTNVPGAPAITTRTPGPSQVTVNWNAPTTTGGSAITGYMVRAYTSSNSATVVGSCSTTGTRACTVLTGLAPGTTYWFEVTAMNANGPGIPSARLSSTPI